MAKEEVLSKALKAKQNAANEAKRLEEKVKAYKASAKNNNLNNNLAANSSQNISNNSTTQSNNSNMKEQLQKKVGTKALEAVGVPKGVSDKAIEFAQSEQGQKMLQQSNKRMFGPLGGAIMSKLMESSEKNSSEETSDGGEGSFKLQKKVIKWALALCASALPIIIFCCLFISASQIFLNAISLGTADSLSLPKADEKINKKGDKGLDEEKSDDDVAYDIYISDEKSEKLKNSKLNNGIVQIAREITYVTRKYNEADLDAIEDFFPSAVDDSKNYDERMVYDFFFKMYNLYIIYRDTYDVNLDLPLLMATLNLQSSDKNVVFSSNLSKEYRTNDVKDIPIGELDYYQDWTSYKISRNNSEHDMEILAQHMVSKQVKEKCVDASGAIINEKILKDDRIGVQTLICAEGQTYQTEDLGFSIDDEKYQEFLRQFIEKKYYLDGEYDIEEEPEVEEETPNEENPQKPAVGDFRSWTQCGKSWSSIIVPNSTSTMCKIGCLITSVTMQIARSGTAITTDSIDPGIAVKKFTFAKGGNFYWNSAKNIAPNFLYKTSLKLTGLDKKSIANKLTSYDSSKYYMVLSVSKKSRNKVHHYVALDYVDKATSEIYIMDPSSTKYIKLYDHYKVYGAYIYEKRD